MGREIQRRPLHVRLIVMRWPYQEKLFGEEGVCEKYVGIATNRKETAEEVITPFFLLISLYMLIRIGKVRVHNCHLIKRRCHGNQ